mmetsp:Transcript_41646/g.60964  ORF Transcript_41646/g.60964 Transcript_41646/m.60964 type:complete len:132 (+) Transcript_41646:110-505(+)
MLAGEQNNKIQTHIYALPPPPDGNNTRPCLKMVRFERIYSSFFFPSEENILQEIKLCVCVCAMCQCDKLLIKIKIYIFDLKKMCMSLFTPQPKRERMNQSTFNSWNRDIMTLDFKHVHVVEKSPMGTFYIP